MMTELPTNASDLSPEDLNDGHIVITLIDPIYYPNFSEIASRNAVTIKDVNVAEGLLLLPPAQDSIDELPHRELAELCTYRDLGIVTPQIAWAMRCSAKHTDPTSTEAALGTFFMTTNMLKICQEVTEAVADNGERTSLNEKNAIGIKTLMVSLIQRWASHIRIGGGFPDEVPDEAQIARCLSRFSIIKSICWEHSPYQSHPQEPSPVVRCGQICYNVPGTQGLALCHHFGSRVSVTIRGISLAGFANRLSSYVYACIPDIQTDLGQDWGLQDGGEIPVHVFDKAQRIIWSSVQGLCEVSFVVEMPPNGLAEARRQSFQPTAADMDAVKRLVLAAPFCSALSILGNPESGEEDFYLPHFQFELGERLPPLQFLHLWRYDWRRHSVEDLDLFWDMSQLRWLLLDEIPMRWFLGIVNMSQLKNLTSLRLMDSEWDAHPGDARQASLMLSHLLTQYIDQLQHLELMCVSTDNLPVAALRRHYFSLERLVLRHPYGLGRNIDATVPSVVPILLQALLQETEEDNRARRGRASLSFDPAKEQDNNVHDTADISSDTDEEGTVSDFDALSTLSGGTTITAPQPAPQGDLEEEKNDEDEESQPQREREVPVDGRGSHMLSRLVTFEFDMDERNMEQGDEPEVLTRLARLPMLRSVSLAVPSLLTNLNCVPKYDADLHNALGRMLFLISQRQQCIAENQNAVHLGPRRRLSNSSFSSLEQITFYVDGFVPNRGNGRGRGANGTDALAGDEEGADIWQGLRENGSPDTEAMQELMAMLVTNVAHDAIVDHDSAQNSHDPLPVLTLDREYSPQTPLPSQIFPTADAMTSTIDRGPGAHGLSFLQPHERHEVDATPGMAPALALRGQGLRSQRCIIAELVRPETSVVADSSGRHRPTIVNPEPRDPEEDISDDEGGGNNRRHHHNTQLHGPHDNSSELKYHLYEEYASYDDVDSPHLTYYQRRDLRENQVHPRERLKLPFIISFARPADLPAPRWDVLGVPIWP
ncbi:hypothetical protein SEUCBS139899_007033 [Sporothrix eucalyptigena]